MCNSDHENLLRMLVNDPRVRTIVSREMIGRFSVQCARYPAVGAQAAQLAPGSACPEQVLF